MSKATEVLADYQKRVKDVGSHLDQLEKRASEIAKTVEARESAKAEIISIRGNVAALESEREGLKLQYAEAQFESDVHKQQSIIRRRKQIDKEIEELRTDWDELAAEYNRNAPDSVELAKVHAELDAGFGPYAGIVKLAHEDLIATLKEALRGQKNELESRRSEIKNSIPGKYDEAAYSERRAELDGSFANYLRREATSRQRIEEQKREDARFAGASSSTDAYADRMPKADPRTVIVVDPSTGTATKERRKY